MAKLKGTGLAILAIFVGVIIAATLIVTIANVVKQTTTIYSVTNQSGLGLAANATADLEGRQLSGTWSVVNGSDGTATNLTLHSARGSNGLMTVQLHAWDNSTAYIGEVVNISYGWQPDGYLPSAADRSIIVLVILFSALGILVFTIAIMWKKGSLGELVENFR